MEFHIAVGSPTSRRSTVWKFYAHKNEIYIQPRIFGSDAKVSLHASGQCQWSCTNDWVKKVPGRRNAERHITKWQMPRPSGNEAVHVFNIRIPETELRIITLVEDLSLVQWIPMPSVGKTVSIECYITPQSSADPAIAANLPHQYLFSMQLANGRWFVILYQYLLFDGCDLNELRMQMCEKSRSVGFEPRPEYRACAFTDSSATARGIIEMCLTV